MADTIHPGRMIPGRYYRVSYSNGPEVTTVEGHFLGREVTNQGDELVVNDSGTDFPCRTVCSNTD